ncbi:MAG: disulfide bond formation protein B [Candidatus Magasanikbacteria bacterium CG10_big_fil_rev_8_21_14_0_10_47_10]|uniref:Disulfide bond formation protein B n=1 Tax=Candidatus Magasanikbacteria bacterium CG10_big_fil_rev_8_21_14_0_10_47_10 TaxID=1974652 RepID=A0A2H0TPN1_9BACT|nr:MAG: disulfide bond formation protein B [Candidatus Magasanikbacteria bacterium CG10_big_fil_rev_8_21_14_0_10_47_10]
MSLLHWLKPRALMLGFVVALIATTGSLFYSEIAGYAPCMLCWYQRIMMYPQVLLLGMAQAKKDAGIAAYGLVLSTVGLVIAGFHYIEQVTYNPLLPCSDLGYAASCTDRFFLNFGYITIPMMAMTAFGLIILAMLSVKKKG